MAEKMEKEDFSIEESLKKIEAITAVLENPATSLKDSLAAYAEGVQLVQACKDNLCDVEKEMIVLSGENSGKELIRTSYKRSTGYYIHICTGRRRVSENYLYGNELFLSGRRKETPSVINAGNLSFIWRNRKSCRAVYGSNRDDTYLFPDP